MSDSIDVTLEIPEIIEIPDRKSKFLHLQRTFNEFLSSTHAQPEISFNENDLSCSGQSVRLEVSPDQLSILNEAIMNTAFTLKVNKVRKVVPF